MRVFLSYAAEDRSAAERVVAALRAADHVVFFDQASLLAGDAFHERLREEIRRSDVFVCLLSHFALAADSYVRIEIDAAVAQWPSPANRIIPARLEGVEVADLPVALQPLHVLDSTSDPIPGVLAAVASARRMREARRRRRLMAALGGLAALAGAVALGRWLTPGRLHLEATSLDATTAGVPPWPEIVHAGGWIDNGTRMGVDVGAARVETTPEGVGLDLVDEPRFTDGPLAPGERRAWEFTLELRDRPSAPFVWRLCAPAAGLGDVCTRSETWKPRMLSGAASAMLVPAALHRRARGVAATAHGFVVAATDPNEVVWLGDDGQLVGSAAAGGELVAVTVVGDQVLAATRDPDAVQAWSADDRTPLWTASFPTLTIGRGEKRRTASSRIQALAGTPSKIWVATSEEQGEAIIASLDRQTKRWAIPSFFNDFDFEPQQLRLAASGSRVWAGNTGVTPSSLHVWTDTGSTTFGGHDVDLVSCADDVAPGSAGTAFIRKCDGELLEVGESEGKLRVVRRLGPLVAKDEDADRDAWSDARLASSPSGFALGLTQGDPARGTLLDARVVWKPRDGDAETLLRLPRGTIEGLAATTTAVAAIIDSSERRGLAVLRLP